MAAEFEYCTQFYLIERRNSQASATYIYQAVPVFLQQRLRISSRKATLYMAAIKSLLLVLSCVIGVSKCSQGRVMHRYACICASATIYACIVTHTQQRAAHAHYSLKRVSVYV